MNIEDLYLDFNKSSKLLENITVLFKEETGMTPVMSAELEFNLKAGNNNSKIPEEKLEEICSSIEQISKNHGVKVLSATKEVGLNQLEVNFPHSENIKEIADNVVKIRDVLSHIAASNNMEVIMDAKPYKNKDVGNGLHIHLSLWDEEKNNKFIYAEDNKILLNSVAGLLKNLPESLVFFTINDQDFSRFSAKFDIDKKEIRYKASATNAPTNISWGINNRTTAIRITGSHESPELYRIEHRVPASDANPYLALFAVLYGALDGIRNNLKPQEKTWGNAFDPQYKLVEFPKNYKEAGRVYQKSSLKKYLNLLKL